MVKNIIDFLKTPKKSPVYEILNLDDKEIEILRLMLEYYLDSKEDVKVKDILFSIYGKDKFKALENIDVIKNLIEEGWIIVNSINQFKVNDLTSLELFNSTISLSISFLKLVEKGSMELIILEDRPYNDHLEFLQDEFLRIEIYEQLANIKNSLSKTSANIKRLQSKLKLIENTIKEKVKKTKIDLPVLNFIKEYDLNEKEEIIFLALLKEEYTNSNENAREMNYLLNLISADEIERIKNRALLDENSKLISEGIIDYDELIGPFGFTRVYFINEDILKDLIHPRKKHKIEHIVKETIFDFIEPKLSLKDIVLDKETEKRLHTLLKQVDKRVLNKLKKWGIKTKNDIDAKIIFYGYPGTGKTVTALAIAKELKKPVLSLDSSKLLSMYVGESEKNVRKLFDEYYMVADKLKTKPVLLLNEADQFLSTRTTASFSSADKMHNQMQNIFLDQIEKFDGILIATTNLLETLDKAFSRRFDIKIEFKKPGFKERVKLWKLKLPKNAEYEENFDIKKLASYELTGAQIEVVIKNTAIKVAMRKNSVFKTIDFIEEIEKEKSNAFDSEKEIGFKSINV